MEYVPDVVRWEVIETLPCGDYTVRKTSECVLEDAPPTGLAPGIPKQSTSSYEIHGWNNGKEDEFDDGQENRTTKSKQNDKIEYNKHDKEKSNRYFDLPFRSPKVKSHNNKMATQTFGTLPRRPRAHTTSGLPSRQPPSRSRSETYIHVPRASFDKDIEYSDDGSLYEQIEIVGESNNARYPWLRDVGIQCQKRYQNAEVQVNLMENNSCPSCGASLSTSEFAINHHRSAEIVTNGHNSHYGCSDNHIRVKPPEIMFNGLPNEDGDNNDDITNKSRSRERPLTNPGIDHFDNIPFMNVDSEAEAFVNMKVKKEKLRLNLPNELLLETKSFPLSPCPSPHKQVKRPPPKVKPQITVSEIDNDYDILDDIVPGPHSDRIPSLPNCSLDSSSTSSLRVPSPELVDQTRAPYPNLVPSSDVTDEEEEPVQPLQNARIRARRGAVISQIPPSSSEVHANDEDSSPGSQNDAQSRRASAASSRSPSQTPIFGESSLFPVGFNSEHRQSDAMSNAGTSLATVAAGHLQDAIESGFNGSGSSLTGTPDALDKKKSKTARILKKLVGDNQSMIKDITDVFKNFKIRDQDPLEFAAFKDKHWKELVSPQENGTQPTVMYSPSEMKRRDKVWELFRAECVYLIEHILVLRNVFQQNLKNLQCENYLMYVEPSKLFANIDELYQVSTAFCQDVIRLLLGKSKTEFGQTEAVVDAFKAFDSKLCPAYEKYCMNYSGALHYLEMLKKRDDFCEYLKLCEQDRQCKRLQLSDLLVAPIQHVTKYPLLLKDIRERTDDETERALLTTTIQTVGNALNELDGKVKWLSNFERLRELQQLIQWPTMEESDSKMGLPEFLRDTVSKMSKNNLLASTKRTLLHEGQLSILENGKPTETYVFLFDDMVLLTKTRKAQTIKKKSIPSCENTAPQPGTPVSRRKDAVLYMVHKPQLPLDRLDIMELDQQKATANGLKNAFVLIQMNRYQQVTAAYTLLSQEESTKNAWLSQVRSAKENWMQMLRDERDNFQPSHRDAQRDRKRTL